MSFETDNAIFFYGHKNYKYSWMSNFYMCKFISNGIEFNCSEQYFMKKKQEQFDPDNTTLANDIIKTKSPAVAKKLGRQVKNYDESTWDSLRYNIMLDAIRLKMQYNFDLKEKLIATHPKQLYEASHFDKIWGIGKSVANIKYEYERTNTFKSNGLNLLGKALMEVREEIIADENEYKV